jgi:c-di-AMP phosphodiesterase-like protein
MFRTDVDDLTKESRLLSGVVIYDDNIAITSCDTDTDSGYRVLASKVADKMLTIKDVEASFALVRIRNTVYISGRSNGNINVQLILEELGGGGHFDAAGAQAESTDIKEVLDMLKQSIDHYKKNNK